MTDAISEQELKALRLRIDSLDEKILELISERARCAQDVARVKMASLPEGEKPVFYRPEREAWVLKHIMERNQGPLDNEEMARLFREIMSSCLALEQPLKVAYLGPEGTFTEAALRTLPEAATRELVPLASVPAALDAVRAGEAAGAFVPVENSVEGAVTATSDELAAGAPLMIYREVLLPITFALLVRPGTALADIKTVTSHPVAQPQVRRWLATNLPDAQWEAAASRTSPSRANSWFWSRPR